MLGLLRYISGGPGCDERNETTVVSVAPTDGVALLGFTAGEVVLELGYDNDIDDPLREAVEGVLGDPLVDESYGDIVDAVMLWWRDDDGDLTDALVDARATLEEGGPIWLLTPKAGRPGHVGQHEVEEAARTAGLHAMSTLSVAPDWAAARLGAQGRSR